MFSQNSDIQDHIKIPLHIAIIMDGNARWAKKNNLPLYSGHKKGVENIQNISQACIDCGVKHLTIYAFSSENWQRSKAEVSNLLKLLDEYLEKNIEPLQEKNIKVNVFGDFTSLKPSLVKKIQNIQNKTIHNNSLTLNVAFSYGARQEIISATKKIAFDVIDKKIELKDITEDIFSSKLYNSDLPDPDLLIRTAGDQRLSNFLLWQLAYSELCFVDSFWPEFSKEELLKCIVEFNKRERRYGKR